MDTYMPARLPTRSGTEEVEHLERRTRMSVTATADGQGNARLELPPVPQGYRWIVDLLTVSSSAADPSAWAYINQISPDSLAWATKQAGNLPAPAHNPFPVNAGERLVIDVVNAGANARVGAQAFIRLLEVETRAWQSGGPREPARVVVVGAELEPAGPDPIGEEVETGR